MFEILLHDFFSFLSSPPPTARPQPCLLSPLTFLSYCPYNKVRHSFSPFHEALQSSPVTGEDPEAQGHTAAR